MNSFSLKLFLDTLKPLKTLWKKKRKEIPRFMWFEKKRNYDIRRKLVIGK